MFSVKPNLKPYLSSEPVRAILGSNATLQALLLDANPMDVTVRWLGPSGDLIPESQCQYSSFSNGSVHVLTLTVTPSSGGVYRCEVENSIGASSVNFTLLVIGEALINYYSDTMHLRIKGYVIIMRLIVMTFILNSTT